MLTSSNRLFALVAFLALVGVLTTACDGQSAPRAEESAGKPVQASATIDFELPVLGGEIVRLSDWRGQWVLVNYWATWCAPCRKEIPDFSAMHDARDDITVLGLAFEDTDVEAFEEFLVDYPASYPILLVDVYAPPEALGAPRALPTSYLVNPAGKLVETWLGPITSDTIKARIDGDQS